MSTEEYQQKIEQITQRIKEGDGNDLNEMLESLSIALES